LYSKMRTHVRALRILDAPKSSIGEHRSTFIWIGRPSSLSGGALRPQRCGLALAPWPFVGSTPTTRASEQRSGEWQWGGHGSLVTDPPKATHNHKSPSCASSHLEPVKPLALGWRGRSRLFALEDLDHLVGGCLVIQRGDAHVRHEITRDLARVERIFCRDDQRA